MDTRNTLIEIVPQGETRAIYALRPTSVLPKKVADIHDIFEQRELVAKIKEFFPNENIEFVSRSEFICEVEAREKRALHYS